MVDNCIWNDYAYYWFGSWSVVIMTKCFMCDGKYYYCNMNGEWCLCPRCDVLRLAKLLKDVKGDN